MSYNLYLASLSNDEVKKIQSMTKHELILEYNEYYDDSNDSKDDYYIPGAYAFKPETLHGLGSWTDFAEELSTKYGTPILIYPEVEEDRYYDSYEFCEISKDGLEFLINYYSQKTSEYYDKMLERITILGADTYDLERFLSLRVSGWDPKAQRGIKNIKLHKESYSSGFSLTDRWDFEYNVFSLATIYNLFDWDNKKLILYGY